MSVLLDSSLYIGANVVDMEKRAYFPSLARMAIAEKKTRQTIAEELRVLYVAMTRARHALHIYVPRTIAGKAKDKSRFVEDITWQKES